MINTFGSNLKYLRSVNHVTQKQLGDKIGVCQTTISKWEKDISEPGIYCLIKLAKYFGVSIDYLVDLE